MKTPATPAIRAIQAIRDRLEMQGSQQFQMAQLML